MDSPLGLLYEPAILDIINIVNLLGSVELL